MVTNSTYLHWSSNKKGILLNVEKGVQRCDIPKPSNWVTEQEKRRQLDKDKAQSYTIYKTKHNQKPSHPFNLLMYTEKTIRKFVLSTMCNLFSQTCSKVNFYLFISHTWINKAIDLLLCIHTNDTPETLSFKHELKGLVNLWKRDLMSDEFLQLKLLSN